MTSTPPLPDRKTKPSKMSRIGSNRRRTIEVSATMLRDILIGNVAGGPGEGNHHVLISASNEDLSCTLPPQVTVSKYSRNDTVVTPLFVRYPPQKVMPEMATNHDRKGGKISGFDTSVGGASGSSSDQNQTSRSISSPDSNSSNDDAPKVMPVSTSSPKQFRRRRGKRAPYYVGDTAGQAGASSGNYPVSLLGPSMSGPPSDDEGNCPECTASHEFYDQSMYRILPEEMPCMNNNEQRRHGGKNGFSREEEEDCCLDGPVTSSTCCLCNGAPSCISARQCTFYSCCTNSQNGFVSESVRSNIIDFSQSHRIYQQQVQIPANCSCFVQHNVYQPQAVAAADRCSCNQWSFVPNGLSAGPTHPLGTQAPQAGAVGPQGGQGAPMKKSWFLKDVVRSVIGGGSNNKDSEGKETSKPQQPSSRKTSAERKQLQKSLAELKLDLPRVQSVSGTVSSEASSSSQTNGAAHIRGRSRSNESSGKVQQVPIPRVQTGGSSKRSLSQVQQFQRNYHRPHAGNDHLGLHRQTGASAATAGAAGRSTRHNLLRATISHKIDPARLHRETVYTAWDHHHGHRPPPRGGGGPFIAPSKHRSLEEPGGGPRSLPNVVARSPGVPRAPIPTPDGRRPPRMPPTVPLETSLDSFGVDTTFGSDGSAGHYQTPNNRDGDYSYAYDSSLSPAFIIKYDDEVGSDESGSGAKPKGPKVENIYEEIAENSSDCSSEVRHHRRGGGGHSHHSQAKSRKGGGRRSDSENSSRKSSSMNSDSGISMSKPHQKYSQGTLDVGPSHHKPARPQKDSDKLSALDSLLFRTAPGMSASQRRDLRKSLVDEVFEELIKRHHDRVLDQLKLDVEDFISPDGAVAAQNNNNSSTKLKKCESMDFKDLSRKDAKAAAGGTMVPEAASGLRAALKKIYSEAFNRKYFGNSKGNKDETAAPVEAVRPQAPVLNNCDEFDCGGGGGASATAAAVPYDDYEEDEGTDRRLRRSQIIQSFLQSDFSLDEEPEDFESEGESAKKSEPATITTRI